MAKSSPRQIPRSGICDVYARTASFLASRSSASTREINAPKEAPMVSGITAWARSGTSFAVCGFGMTLPLFETGAAQRHAVIQRHVFADLGRLADDHAHAVVDEKTRADPGAGVDLDPGESTHDVGCPTRQDLEPMRPQTMPQPVPPDGVQPGITQQDLQPAARRRIAGQHSVNVAAKCCEHDVTRADDPLPAAA